MEEKKKPFHEEFAEKVIGMLEQGTAPWQRPWTPAENLAPRNPLSGTVYKGVNRITLDPAVSGFSDPRWMTLKQANDAGYKIKKGSRSAPIIFFTFTKQVDKLDDKGKPILGEDGKPEKETVRLERPVLRVSRVFNAEQVEGFPALDKKELEYAWNPHEKAEAILSKSGAVIKHDQVDRAFYTPFRDEIHLPPRSSFDAQDKYYATALHELGHWTGHKSRMGREFGPFGSEKYAREELRAEISSWMVGQDIGVGHDPGQHAAYVKSWIQDLKDNPMEIMRACRDAEQIRDYVMGLEMEKESSKTVEYEAQASLAVQPAASRTYLCVPYKEKEIAKAHGARWDAKQKQWYAPEGTDIAPLSRFLAPPERAQPLQNCLEPRQEFAQKLAELGLDLKGELPELDGKLHRVPVLDKNGRGLDGVYCLHGDGRPAGWAQNHVTGEKVKLVASGVVLSPAERERQQQERAERLKQAELARVLEYDAAAARALRSWNRLEEAKEHPYLKEKGVEAFGIRHRIIEGKDRLAIPLRNIEGDLRGFQVIQEDGSKYFFPGMEKKGNFHLIEGKDKQDLATAEIILCEGYATGASLHMATDKPVAVAFDAGNLEIVAEKIREKYPQAQITICADNDHAIKRDNRINNIGVEKAELAAKAVGGKVVIPTFSDEEKAKGLTDFNDLHKSRGLDEVRKQLGKNMDRGMDR